MRTGLLRRCLTAFLSIVLVGSASLVGPAAPASAAPNQSTQDVTAGLDQWFGFAGRLGNVGALAQPVPGLTLAPGGPGGLGLGDFYSAWRSEKLGGWTGVDTLDQAVAKLNGADGTLADGRAVTVDASSSTLDDVTAIVVTLGVRRTVTSGLAVGSTSPPFSFASTAGVSITLNAQLTFTARYDASDRFFFIDRSPATPALTVGISGSIDAPASAKAALGILGVELGDASNLTLTASITGRLADPNGDNRLAFAEPGGVAGELAAPAAEKGLATVVLAGGGSLHGTLVIVGTQHTAIANLPTAASATVRIDSADLATQPVAVSYDPGALDPVQAFMTLSNRDLADGLAQLAAGLRAAARARDSALPFMRGAVSDALMVEEALLEFLKLHVEQPPSGSVSAGDRPAVGQPDFASLQDLIDELTGVDEPLPSGARFSIAGGEYDAANHKLRLPITISRSAGGAQPLDPVGAALSGSGDAVSYTGTTLKDTSKDFTKTEGLVGRQIVAGTSSAIIDSVVDANTLRLSDTPFGPGPVPASLWQGGTPAAKAPYSISGLDPRTGQVELGDVLAARTGIKVANASAPLATVKPSYTVTLPLVLDLQPPRTDNCNPAGSPVQPCPYQVTNPGGTATIISSLPLPAQRLMLHTGGTLFAADAPISTAVDVTASAGFLQVKLTGTLRVCTAGASTDCASAPPADKHLMTVGLKPGGDAQGDISLPDLFRAIQQNPTGMLSGAISGQAYADLTLSVPDAPSLLAGDAAKFTLTLPDLTNPAGAQISTDFPMLRAFDQIDPNDPQVLFGVLLAALREAATRLHSLSGTGVDVELPVVGRKVSDLLGATETGGGPGVTYAADSLTDTTKTFLPANPTEADKRRWVGRRLVVGTQIAVVKEAAANKLTLVSPFSTVPAAGTPYAIGDELTAAVDRLTANPSTNLQDLVREVNAALGPQSAVRFDVAAGTPPTLVLTVDWQRAYRTEAPLAFDFSFGGSDRELVGTNAQGTLKAELSGQVKLVLRVPLEAATVTNPLGQVKVDPGQSQLSVRAKLDSGPTVSLSANLGPLAVSLGKPGANPTGAEAHVDLGFSVRNTTDTSPVALGTYLSHLAATFTANEVTCAGLPADPKLAACAKLPVYLKLGGSYDLLVPGDETASSFILTVRKDATALTPEVTTPSAAALQAKFDSMLFDLRTLGDGLDSYLRYLDLAIEVANAGGSLPVVGDDLQQGKAFLEKLRNDIRTVLGPDANGGNLKFSDFGGVSSYLNNQLKNALPAGASLTVGADCAATLAPVTGVNATVESGSGTTTYTYRVVATRTADGTGPTLASAPDSVQNGVLGAKNSDDDPVNKNRVQWTASRYADHYLVLRKVGNGAEKLVATVTGTSYVDDGSATESAVPSLPSTAPQLKNCPGESITGLTLAIDMGQGDPANPGPCGGETCHVEVPLDLGLPGLSIKATGNGGDKITGAIGWRLHLKVGLSRDSGFFIHTQDEHPGTPGKSAPELRLGASLDLPDEMQAQLAFITVDVAKRSDHTSTPLFKGQFSVDLRAPGDTVECVPDCAASDSKRLTLGDLTSAQNISSLVVPRLSATADIGLQLKATASSALPGIQADFLLKWVWSTAAPGAGDLQTLRFENVKIDPGPFLGKVLKPIFKQINDLYQPIKPIVDTIKAPIPVLSDLSRAAGGGDVSLLTIATAFSDLGGPPIFGKFVDVFLAVERVFNALPTVTATVDDACSACISVGGFDIKPDLARTTVNSPDVASRLLGNQQPAAGTPLDKFDSTIGLKTTKSDDAHPGFTFPALEQPSLIFGLLLGQDVAIAEFDSGPLSLGFTFSQSFGPVYAPPPVFVTISGSASVSLRIAAGFDTFGLRQAFEEQKAVNILNSLYFKTVDSSGKPIPVVQFSGSLAAGAMVSAFVISVGIEGGITLTVSFTWNDPTNDGKFRFFEFLTSALNNPLCLFNVGGKLSVFVRVFIKIGICPFCTEFSFTLVNATLLEFKASPDCTPPPPVIADKGKDTSTLYLFAGRLGTGTLRGHSAWDSSKFDKDEFVVRQEADGKVTVTALGISRTFEGVDTVVLDGRDHDKPINATFAGAEENVLFTKKVIVIGGDAADTIRTGNGVSWVDGRGQDDTITTVDRPDLKVSRTPDSLARVAGGAGGDTISVGNGDDWVAGDSALTFGTEEITFAGGAKADSIVVASVNMPASVLNSANGDGHDVIAVGLGDTDVFTGGGGDTVGVSADNPQGDLPANAAIKDRFRSPGVKIVGGTGGDRLTGGTGPDEIYTGALAPGLGADQTGSGDADADVNIVDTGSGTDLVHGSNGVDLITGHSATNQVDTFYGHGGPDVLMGSYGPDLLYGGPGDDVLAAEPSTVGGPGSASDVLGSTRSVVHLPNPNPPANKTLVGGGGTDRIYGGDGGATIYGDHTTDGCASGTAVASDAPDEHPVVSDPPNAAVDDAADVIIGGNGIDTVNAGGGDDHVTAFDGQDLVCGNAGRDTIDAGNAADQVWGGTGGDTIHGGPGRDSLYGNAGNDTAYGGDDQDTIEGNADSDTLFGGEHDDTLFGGTQLAGRADGGDYLYGDNGADLLVGDNGTPAGGGAADPFDLDGTVPGAGGNDRIFGGPGSDHGYGGLANDTLSGGTEDDMLQGNNGVDTIFGGDQDDDITGGSSQQAPSDPLAPTVGRPDAGDLLFGQDGQDVILGDNGVIARVPSEAAATPVARGRGLVVNREVGPYDLGYSPTDGTSGGDEISGGDGTDLVFGQGGTDKISAGFGDDYAEGGQAGDVIFGDPGEDDLVGGSVFVAGGAGALRTGQPDGGDAISGGLGADVALGDNGALLRIGDPSPLTLGRGITPRAIDPYDLAGTSRTDTFGADLISGGVHNDVLLGQNGNDRVRGDADDDYVEGGQAADWVEGNDGDDDLVGGGATLDGTGSGGAARGQADGGDVVFGGAGDDVAFGDNAVVTRVGAADPQTLRVNPAGVVTARRALRPLDLENGELSTPDGRFGGDQVSGGSGVDVLFGQDGSDAISGGPDDDYAEGNGAHDRLFGDRTLAAAGIAPPAVGWPGAPSDAAGLEGDLGRPDGQDDLLGGSPRAGFRDASDEIPGVHGDEIHGDGAADFAIGDNGSIVRDVLAANGQPVPGDTAGGTGPVSHRVYTLRYASPPPPGAAYLRHGTRFCQTRPEGTCERPGAYGDDQLFGEGGDDTLYGQDGNDTMRGGDQDDDMYGELGDDRMFGDAGDDAMLGDRGGVVDKREDGTRTFTFSSTQVPRIDYTGFVAGSVTRHVDLRHDVDGAVFVGGPSDPAMPYDGVAFGGNDRMRGGTGHDSMHGGVGDDLMNGDSGGDILFGDDGADVMWGGKGGDDPANPNDRGAGDSFVDYLAGGAGATSGPSTDPVTGSLGADVIDFQPRGTYAGCTSASWPGENLTGAVVDPCAWFEMTSMDDADAANDQHHQGIDWMYGGWDRDVLQADVADNGPNMGDRLLDWNGAYNLYTHCNAAYGGYNDVRQHSPTMQQFLLLWAGALGAGQGPGDVSVATTAAYDELALVYQPDVNDHGSGGAFPQTPGHFYDLAC